jgi:hypothetical protein
MKEDRRKEEKGKKVKTPFFPSSLGNNLKFIKGSMK